MLARKHRLATIYWNKATRERVRNSRGVAVQRKQSKARSAPSSHIEMQIFYGSDPKTSWSRSRGNLVVGRGEK